MQMEYEYNLPYQPCQSCPPQLTIPTTTTTTTTTTIPTTIPIATSKPTIISTQPTTLQSTSSTQQQQQQQEQQLQQFQRTYLMQQPSQQQQQQPPQHQQQSSSHKQKHHKQKQRQQQQQQQQQQQHEQIFQIPIPLPIPDSSFKPLIQQQQQQQQQQYPPQSLTPPPPSSSSSQLQSSSQSSSVTHTRSHTSKIPRSTTPSNTSTTTTTSTTNNSTNSTRSTHLIPRENVFLIPNFIRNNKGTFPTGLSLINPEDAMPFSCYRQVRDKYHNADIFKGLTFKVQYHQFTSIDHVLKCPDSSKNQERIFVRGDTVNVFLPPGIADITALDNCDDCVWFVVAKAKRNFANKLWRRSFKSIRGALDLSSIKLIEEFIPIVEYGRVNREPKVKSRPSDAIDLVSQSQSQSQQSLSSSLGSSGSNMGAVCANDDGGISGSVGEIGGSDSEFDEKLVRLLKSSAVLPRLVALRKTQVPPPPLSPVLPDDKLFIGECVDDSGSSKKKGFGSEGVAENKEFVPIRPPISTSPSLQTLINVSSAMPKEIVKKENTLNNNTNNTTNTNSNTNNTNNNNNCNTNNACNNCNSNDVEKIVSDSDSGKVTTIYSPLLKPDPELLAPLPSQSSTTQINPPLPSTSPSLSQNPTQNIPQSVPQSIPQNVPQNIHNFNEGSHYSTMPTQLPPTLSSLSSLSSSSSSSSSSTSTNPNNISTIIRCSNSSSSSSSSMSTGIMTSSGVIGVVGVGVVGAAGAAAAAGMAYEVECFQINPVQGKSLWIECGLYPIYKDGALVYPVVEEPVFPSVVRHSDDSTLFDSLVSVGQECLNSPSFKNPPK